MKVLMKYWPVLIALILASIILVFVYDGVTPNLSWKEDSMGILAGLFTRLLISAALIDQFIAVFFPEETESKIRREIIQSALTEGRNKVQTCLVEIIRMETAAKRDEDYIKKIKNDLEDYDSNNVKLKGELLSINRDRSRKVRMYAFGISLFVAVAGLKVFSELIDIPVFEPGKIGENINFYIIYYLDMIFTAALLSGGVDGINHFFRSIRSQISNKS